MPIPQTVFDDIKSVSGFQGSALYASNGELILSATANNSDMGYIGALAVELYKSAKYIADKMQLGVTNFVEIHTENSIFIHSCIIPGVAALGVLCSNTGNTGLIKFEMKKLCSKLRAEFKP